MCVACCSFFKGYYPTRYCSFECVLDHNTILPLEDSDCWIWIGRKDIKGYGRTGFKGEGGLAHVMSFQRFNHKMAKGFDVMHSCDNPSCVNPAHLSLGTRKDNMQDKANKKRSTWGIKSSTVVLNEDQVKTIFRSNRSAKVLSNFYNVHESTIRSIWCRKTWRHLEI